MADAGTGFNHRHLAVSYHLLNQACTAPWNNHVNIIPQLQHHIHGSPVRLLYQLDGALRDTGMIGCLRHNACNCFVGNNRLGTAPQENGIAGFQAQPDGIRRYVRPCLVNHAHDTQRHPYTADFQPVGTDTGIILLPDRIRQGCRLTEAVCHACHTALIQQQPVQERTLDALFPGFLQINGICLQYRATALLQGTRHSQKRVILGNRRKIIHAAGGVFCRLCLIDNPIL